MNCLCGRCAVCLKTIANNCRVTAFERLVVREAFFVFVRSVCVAEFSLCPTAWCGITFCKFASVFLLVQVMHLSVNPQKNGANLLLAGRCRKSESSLRVNP